VNHSAIYLAIVLGVAAAWVFDAFGRWSPAARLAALSVFAILLVSLVVMASRAAAAAGLLLLVLLGFAWWRRSRLPLLAMLGAGCIVVAGAALLHADLIEKQALYESRGQPLSHRDTAWRTGFEAWARHPWFGIGMDNFSQLSEARVGAWRREAGRAPAPFVFFPHAHSLYVNTLAERGVVGFAALLAVLGAWLATLLRSRPSRHGEADWLLWGAAASGLFVTAVAGLLNTTLHHEHGILAALLLGLWAGRTSASPAS
jgi:O-antigen ligase